VALLIVIPGTVVEGIDAHAANGCHHIAATEVRRIAERASRALLAARAMAHSVDFRLA
jgi:hypothetical protein